MRVGLFYKSGSKSYFYRHFGGWGMGRGWDDFNLILYSVTVYISFLLSVEMRLRLIFGLTFRSVSPNIKQSRISVEINVFL